MEKKATTNWTAEEKFVFFFILEDTGNKFIFTLE